ncbi:MAG: TetR/AcrR family transcriptional regulator [Pseudomonadales bacterium]|nr:TetR/AcrR family transcriptional regulator [Pseudomonadales bacterium]MCP5173186.1 TetR/AcrR family transcriptional regulator [Pseudomonadales bacterium]
MNNSARIYTLDTQSLDCPDPMRRIPQQERSRRMVAAIVEAGLKILCEHGREGLSTTSLELVSGVPKSTIYEYFPNLDAVVAEVFHFVIRHYHENGYSLYPLQEPPMLHEFMASIVDWVLIKHKTLLTLDRGFYLRYSRFFDFWMEFDKNFLGKDSVEDFLTRQLCYCRDFISGQNDRVLAQATAHSLSLTTYVMIQETPRLIDDSEFRKMLVRMCIGICAK